MGFLLFSLFQIDEDKLRNGLQCLEYTFAGGGAGLEVGDPKLIEFAAEGVHRENTRKVPFIVLNHEGNLFQFVPLLFEVDPQIIEGFDIGIHPVFLGIGNKDDTIHTFEDELTGGIIKDLARDGVQMETGLEAANLAERQRKEVEEEGPFRFCCQTDHLAFGVGSGLLVDILEIGGLAAKAGAVIDNFTVDFA